MLEKVNAKKPSKVKPNQHPLKEILEGALGFSEMQLRQELRWHGLNVFPGLLCLMLDGLEPMPEEIEKALRHIAAEYIEDRELSAGQVDEVIEEFLRTDDDGDDESF